MIDVLTVLTAAEKQHREIKISHAEASFLCWYLGPGIIYYYLVFNVEKKIHSNNKKIHKFTDIIRCY